MGDIIKVNFDSAKRKRLVFEFDESSYNAFEDFRRRMGAKDLGEALKVSLEIYRALQQQFREGYTELHVRNPTTGDRNQLTYGRPLIA